jgi:hypothetical protein
VLDELEAAQEALGEVQAQVGVKHVVLLLLVLSFHALLRE